MKRRLLLIVMLLACTLHGIMAQNRTITGKVTSKDDNSPVIGATVLVKGTTNARMTDVNGNFSIDVTPASKTLVFSFIGYVTKEVAITEMNVMDVVLETDNISLDEVVVTGYGNFTKASYTGAASVMNTNKLQDLPVVSLSQMLDANVPGLSISGSSGQPGSTTNMQVRGKGSINASTEPLFVLDGVPVISTNLSNDDNSSGGLGILSTINPNDIESITVLKDASSTSLYGARGSNGVILITTKRGKEGKTTYSFKGSFGVSSLATQFRPIMGGEERRELIHEGYVNNKLNAGMSLADAKAYADKNIDTYASRPESGYSDWINEMFHTGKQQNYSFSATGGTKASNFSASIGYTNQEGISLSSGFERFSARINYNNTYRKFEFSISNLSSLTHNKMTPEGGYYASAMYSSRVTLTPSIPIYNPDGTYHTGFSNNGGYNPINEDAYSSYNTRAIRVNNSIVAAYNILPSLKLSTTFNVDYASTKEFRYWGPQTNDGKESNGVGNMSMLENLRFNSVTMLSYIKSFKKHNINAIAAYEIQETSYEGLNAIAKGYGQTINNSLSNASVPSEISQPKTRDALLSYVARANYDYDNKYYLSASFRRDGSSRLSEVGRWSNFWSLSASWRITQEKFMQSTSKWLTDLKLRASYGVTGNLPSGLYDYFGSYSTGYAYNDEPAIRESRIPFPGLTWEKGKNWNIGLDINLIGRIGIVLDVYQRNTTDLLMSKPLNTVSGFGSMTANVGELQNSGVELEIRSTNIAHPDFTWSTSLNVSNNQNKIIKLSDLPSYVDGRYTRREGYTWSTLYLREYAGVDPETGLAQYYTNKTLEDGSIDRTITNNPNDASPIPLVGTQPKFFGGLTNTFKWKDIDLSFNLSFTLGGHSYDDYMYALQNDGYALDGNFSTELRDRWQNPGDITDVPRFVSGYGSGGYFNSSRGIHSTDHLRLKSLSLGYNFPKKWMQKIGFNNVRVYFSGTNLLTWAKYDQYDPELSGAVGMGVPPFKTFSFGLDFSL